MWQTASNKIGQRFIVFNVYSIESWKHQFKAVCRMIPASENCLSSLSRFQILIKQHDLNLTFSV